VKYVTHGISHYKISSYHLVTLSLFGPRILLINSNSLKSVTFQALGCIDNSTVRVSKHIL